MYHCYHDFGISWFFECVCYVYARFWNGCDFVFLCPSIRIVMSTTLNVEAQCLMRLAFSQDKEIGRTGIRAKKWERKHRHAKNKKESSHRVMHVKVSKPEKKSANDHKIIHVSRVVHCTQPTAATAAVLYKHCANVI